MGSDRPGGETAWAESVADETGFPTIIVVQAWLGRKDVEDVLNAQAGFARVRGVRERPRWPPIRMRWCRFAPGSMSDPEWQRGYALLEARGLSFDLQAPFWHLPEARALAERFPGIVIILDHTGLPTLRSPEGLAAWRKCMRTLAEAPNTAVKISGLGEPHLPKWSVRTHRDVVLETIDIFGSGSLHVRQQLPGGPAVRALRHHHARLPGDDGPVLTGRAAPDVLRERDALVSHRSGESDGAPPPASAFLER